MNQPLLPVSKLSEYVYYCVIWYIVTLCIFMSDLEHMHVCLG